MSSDNTKQDLAGYASSGSGSKAIRVAMPIVLLAIGWIGYSLLSHEPEKAKSLPAKPQAIRTKVAELRLQDYPVIIKANGLVQPHNEITVAAQVSGRVVRISPEFEDGAFFSEGDVLIKLDDADHKASAAVSRARLLGAQARLKLAQVNHQRNLEVLKENLISQAEADLTAANLAQGEADVASAVAQLEQAERDLERTQIRAPFDGRVRQRNVGLGQLVGANTTLGTVFSVDFAEVRLPIAGRELFFVDLPNGDRDTPIEVELRDAINPDSTNVWPARIVRSEGALDENSLELFVIARVDDPFGRVSGNPPLRIGQPVVGRITGRVLEGVVALPRAAVRQLDQIFLIDQPDLTLRAHTIVPLWEDEKHVIIGDPSITNGTMLAMTHLVYAPNGATVEIIPDIVTNVIATAASSNATTAKPAVAKAENNKKS